MMLQAIALVHVRGQNLVHSPSQSLALGRDLPAVPLRVRAVAVVEAVPVHPVLLLQENRLLLNQPKPTKSNNLISFLYLFPIVVINFNQIVYRSRSGSSASGSGSSSASSSSGSSASGSSSDSD
jgi:uncharacterized membrane protein YgcG